MFQERQEYPNSYAAVYCRLSKDDEQAGESISIETQKMMLQDYCREQGFLIYDFYIDDGYSGLNFNRPGFLRMLSDIDSGKVSLVITKDLSRLGRDYIQTGYYTDVYFSQKRVRYIALNDGIDTDRDNNDIAPFKNILNDMYAKDLSRKVKAAKRLRACKGYYISSQTPYGYRVDPMNHNHLIVDPEAAAVVKDIYRLALEGNSLNQIRDNLTARKVIKPGVYKAQNGDTRFLRYCKTSEDATKWCSQTVRAILRDQVYTGAIVNHRTEITNYKTKEAIRLPKEEYIIVPNCHEAIVSEDDYERVQSLISFRHRPKKHQFENVFRDLTFCAECGHRMSMMIKPLKVGPAPLLRCTNHFLNPEQCRHNHYIYYEDLYREVFQRLLDLEDRIKSGELLRFLQRDAAKQGLAKKTLSEYRKIEKRLVLLKKIVRSLYEDFANDLLDSDSYHSLLVDYLKEQKQLSSRLATLEAKIHHSANLEKNVQKLQAELEENLRDEALSANLLNRVIERIEVIHTNERDRQKNHGVTIIYRFIGTNIET